MKKIGIVIAMEEEFQAIENKIKEIKVHEEKGLKFFEGKIGEKECVIVKSGVGKVNAARTTQAMIDNFDIEYIINKQIAAEHDHKNKKQHHKQVQNRKIIIHPVLDTGRPHFPCYII